MKPIKLKYTTIHFESKLEKKPLEFNFYWKFSIIIQTIPFTLIRMERMESGTWVIVWHFLISCDVSDYSS